MPASLKRASSAFLDSPVKPGNDRFDGDVVIIMRPLINSRHGERSEAISLFLRIALKNAFFRTLRERFSGAVTGWDQLSLGKPLNPPATRSAGGIY